VSLCVFPAVRDALNKARKKDREALAEALKKIYRAKGREEAEETLRNLRERWGTVYPKIVKPRLMLFWLSCTIQGLFAATSTPQTNWSGWPRR
jgi:transposase-like protein